LTVDAFNVNQDSIHVQLMPTRPVTKKARGNRAFDGWVEIDFFGLSFGVFAKNSLTKGMSEEAETVEISKVERFVDGTGVTPSPQELINLSDSCFKDWIDLPDMSDPIRTGVRFDQ
jgi:hypothetical protein